METNTKIKRVHLKRITVSKNEDVYDITVPGNHNFYGNGILVHNCAEIGMYAKTEEGESGWQACNLVEINGGKCDTPEKFYEICEAASAICTLQAGYTDFGFLGDVSRRIIEREALIGVSITGWMNNPNVLFDEDVMRNGARIVKETNAKVAKLIGINPAARCTTVKPSGNASTVLRTASGIHGEHSKRYFRHVQMNNEVESLQAIKMLFPEMVESSVWSTHGTDSVVAFPIIPKEGSIYKKDLLGVKQLEYVKKAQQVWVEDGTNYHLCVKPWLRHNVSNTITVDDWSAVEKYLFANRKYFCGVSLLAAAGDRAYPQAPFTEVLTASEIMDRYGVAAMFASGLITRALDAFNGDLWAATSCALGYGEDLGPETHETATKRDIVRQINKFAKNHFDDNISMTCDCLKDVYNLHKWTKITKSLFEVDIREMIKPKQYVDAGSLVGAACSGGNCEVNF